MILIAALAAAAAPQPGELKTFKDWVVGCDNGRACQAVALMPENSFTGATLALKRGPDAGAVPEVWVTARGEGGAPLAPTVLEIDGQAFPLVPEPYGTVAARHPAGVAARLAQATRLALLDRTGRRIAEISTAGSAAALLYMDAQQRRLGTTSALVRRGSKASVPPAPPLPVVRAAAGSPKPPVRLSAATVRRLRGKEACSGEGVPEDQPPDYHRLDARHTLALVPLRCSSGAYNYVSMVFVVDERGRAAPAILDYGWGRAQDRPDHYVYGAAWDAKTRRLETFFRGRGLGDCGTGESYAWDGQRFRLVERTVMSECRGSTDYITVWRAEVR